MNLIKQMSNSVFAKTKIWVVISLVFMSLAIIFGYFYFTSTSKASLLSSELEKEKLAMIELEGENSQLANELEAEKYKNSLFSGQIQEIASTVGNLDKLSKTDKELLQKYSKVYFLNEHYVPESLAEINKDFLHEPARNFYFHSKAYPFLETMLKDAKEAGVDLKIISAYRSFAEQTSLKNQYSVTYGSGANKFSADQGYSEHQLGTTLDFTTSKTGSNFNAFDSTESYKWLIDNAYKYGFILSYPDGNEYYQYEPWHWRFVGKALAFRLHEEKERFYDLKQSQIDPYLLKIFDN